MSSTERTAPAPRALDVLVLGAEWFGDRPGGLNRYVTDLSRGLTRAEVAHQVAVVSGAGAAPAAFRGADAMGRSLPIRVLRFARLAARLGTRTDVIDAHFALYAALPVLLPPLRRKPLVVHFHGPWADESRVADPRARVSAASKRWLERRLYRKADRLVVLSDAFSKLLQDRYGIDPSRIEVVPPAVDLDVFQIGDQDASRRQLGLPTGDFVAVVARRLEARMGIDILLDAWRIVTDEHPTALLLVVGSGSQGPALERRAAELGIAGSVRFTGRLSESDLVAAYRAADVSVVPTTALEGFGLVVLESLACGTPVVVTDVGGLPEAVHGLEGAAVVPPGDVDSIARALLRSAEGATPPAAACRAHAERFSSEALGRRHREIFDLVTAPRPRVLYVDHCAQPSGGELSLARLLPALDVDAHVLLGEHGPLVGILEAAGVPVEVSPVGAGMSDVRKDDVRPGRIPWRGVIATGRAIWRLRARIRELGPDIVHTNSLKAALYGGVAGRLAGVPVVWHIRDRIADDYLPPAAVRLVRAAGRFLPAAVITNSRATQEALGPVCAVRAVVPSPVDLPVAVHDERDARTGPLRIAMVGRLAPWKGQHVFLDAFAEAFGDGEARAEVVGGALFGEDRYEAELLEQAARLRITERISFTGHLEDVSTVLARADVLVHASTTPEPFGQVIVEGMAAGVPVIASDAGGPAEIIDDGVNGLLHPPGDAPALASCLRRLADDPALRRRLAAEGARRAHDFSAPQIAPLVHAVYDEILRVR